jgi:hypothetical protein
MKLALSRTGNAMKVTKSQETGHVATVCYEPGMQLLRLTTLLASSGDALLLDENRSADFFRLYAS